jgi:hypothetical protein
VQDLRRNFAYGPAVYGSVLVTALVGAGYEAHTVAKKMTLTLLATTVVFWLAHVWSEAVGERLEGALPSWTHLRRLAVAEWPLVEAGFVPAGLLALAWIGVYSRETGAKLALAAALLELVGWGFVAAWRSQRRIVPAVVAGAVDCAFGLAIVGLEIAIH